MPGGADTSHGARPPVFDTLGMFIPHKQSKKSRPQSVDRKADGKNACYVYEAVNYNRNALTVPQRGHAANPHEHRGWKRKHGIGPDLYVDRYNVDKQQHANRTEAGPKIGNNDYARNHVCKAGGGSKNKSIAKYMQVEILLSIQNDRAVKTVQNDTRQDKRAQKGKRRQHRSRNDSAHTLPSPGLRQPPRFLDKARTDKARHNASRDERKEQCMGQRGYVEQQTAKNLCIAK